MKKTVLAAAIASWIAAEASAQSLEQSLAKLAPEFRSHQACILRGLETVRREPSLRKADRMKTSIFSQAVLAGTRLTAKGGAVKSGSHWHALSFTCDLTAGLMKATSFVYALGAEIPEREWEQLGLWR